MRQKIAVIGSGISGLASAYFLQRSHDVTLFESGNYLGGHSNTVEINLNGVTHPVDTGFLVLNERTYPNLLALFAELGVTTYTTDMSFGVSLGEGELEWAGTNLDTVFAQRKRLLSPSFLNMLRDILRFNQAAETNLIMTTQNQMSLAQLLDDGRYGAMFRDAYLLPMAAAIWSSSPEDILLFPASTFLRFCLNHALLQVNDRPKWQTVRGGARTYVQKIAAQLNDIRLQSPVTRVVREGNVVLVSSLGATERFDGVVFATHAPDTLQLLADANYDERKILGAVRYQANTAYLHTDSAQLPKIKKVWSAWNYLGGKQTNGSRPVCVTYLLNQLQELPYQTPVMVTLNPFQVPSDQHILGKFDYQHPVFDAAAIAAQQRLSTIQGKSKIWFAGAWTGYGFHEDGLKSALRVAADFRLAPVWSKLS